MSPCIKHLSSSKIFSSEKKKKQGYIFLLFPLLSGDVPGRRVTSSGVWVGNEWRVVGGSPQRYSGGETVRKREVVFNRTTERWRGHWECTQIKLTSWCISVTVQQWGFGRGLKGLCGEKGNALSQCHAYVALQPAIGRESSSALYHRGFKSTLQSQGWSSIFSDTVPPGAFPCLGLLWRKAHTLYQWQPRALNLVQGRGRIQQVNTLDSFNLLSVLLLPPSEPVVREHSVAAGLILNCVECGVEGNRAAFHPINPQLCAGFVIRPHAFTKSTLKLTFLVEVQWSPHACRDLNSMQSGLVWLYFWSRSYKT